ncbi:MAG: NUDIX domain-containing protein, partial [Erysipelotrichaceae bacterium]|nr:NUDIX domain-containing protein [Erysipelotrichaceae bacterium]
MEVKVKKHVEVVAAVIKKGDYYFAAKRNEFGEMGGRYEFPGGKIEQGESNEAALIREIKEELNAEIEVVEFIMTVNHEYETFKITLHAYLC